MNCDHNLQLPPTRQIFNSKISPPKSKVNTSSNQCKNVFTLYSNVVSNKHWAHVIHERWHVQLASCNIAQWSYVNDMFNDACCLWWVEHEKRDKRRKWWVLGSVMVNTMVAHVILGEVHLDPMVEVFTPTQDLMVDLAIETF